MRSPLYFLFFALLFISCGSSKKASGTKPNTVHVGVENKAEIPVDNALPAPTNRDAVPEISPLVKEVVSTAMSYHGTRYKYGGTTKRGMDCSGLIYTSFDSINIPLQRTSSAMATQGEKIKVEQVKKGDLLFFTTGRSKSRVNHVGLVVEVMGDDIRFIHSTTSRGVLVSSLREGYWNHAFHHARRIL